MACLARVSATMMALRDGLFLLGWRVRFFRVGANQIEEECIKFCKYAGLKTVCVVGGQDIETQVCRRHAERRLKQWKPTPWLGCYAVVSCSGLV